MRALFTTFALPVLLAGCTDSTTAPPAESPGIPTDHTEPAALIEAFEAALEARDLDAYAALLEPGLQGTADPGFRYVPPAEDLPDFPWLQGQPWDRDLEIGLVGNMCDPEFESPQTLGAVDSIAVAIVLLGETDPGGDEIEVTTRFEARVFWSFDAGSICDVRLVWRLAPDDDGFLRIRRQEEYPLLGPRVEDDGWARIKGLHHGV